MDHGASRHYIPLVFFFFPLPLLSHLHTQCKARAENTAGRKNATASVLIPASTAQCTRQKHPLNIGVYGPRRGKSTRVKPPWSFGHLSAFAMLFLPVFLSISLSLSLSLLPRLSPLSLTECSLLRFLFLNQQRTHTRPPLNRLPAFPASSPTVSLILILILFAPIFRLSRPRTRECAQLLPPLAGSTGR